MTRRTIAYIFLAALALSAGDTVARPDRKLTPGATDAAVTQATIQSTVCVVGYAMRARDVSESTKLAVFREYKIDPTLARAYEVDHLISLENGGSNDIRNLWPQPYAPKPGAREKDVLETFLKRQVCAGKMTLAIDQKELRADWYAAYRKYGLDKK